MWPPHLIRLHLPRVGGRVGESHRARYSVAGCHLVVAAAVGSTVAVDEVTGTEERRRGESGERGKEERRKRGGRECRFLVKTIMCV